MLCLWAITIPSFGATTVPLMASFSTERASRSRYSGSAEPTFYVTAMIASYMCFDEDVPR